MGNLFRSALFPLIAILLLVYLAAQTLTSGDGSSARIRYSELIATAERSPEQIREVAFVPNGKRVEATFSSGREVEAHYPTEASQLAFQRVLERQNIPFDAKSSGQSAWWSILTYLLPFVLFFGFWILLRRRRASERSPDDLRMRIEQLECEVADLRATVASGLGA